jgi:hypothetical protein
MRPVFAWMAACVVPMSWAASAAAADPFLNGKLDGPYGFTGSAACLVAPGSSTTGGAGLLPGAGFNSSFQPNNPATAFSNSFSVEGIRTFNGNGTGTVKGTTVSIAPPPTPMTAGTFPSFPPDAGSDTFSYNFTYTVNADGSWTSAMVAGSFTGTFVTGPRTGQTYSIDQIPPIDGLIEEGGLTLIGAHVTTQVETVTYSNGNIWPRVCHRSRVYIKLAPQRRLPSP